MSAGRRVATVCKDIVVLPVPRSANPSASAACTLAGCRQVKPARQLASDPPRLPLSSACPMIDSHGDHIHTCQQHTGSTKDARETILDALQQICYESGLTTHRRNIPLARKANGRTGRGDLGTSHQVPRWARHLPQGA